MASIADSSKVRLESKDKRIFEIDRRLVEDSKTIKHMMEDLKQSEAQIPLSEVMSPIPLSEVTGPILEKVIDFCQWHQAHPSVNTGGSSEASVEEVTLWEKEFRAMDQSTLFELILAANYLDIKALLEATCLIVAGMIKGKNTEEIRRIFNIKDDFTPEEAEAVRRENEWTEDK